MSLNLNQPEEIDHKLMTMPHFKYHLTNVSRMNFGCIEVAGEVIHKIDNVDEFYKEFGYTPDIRKAGVLPDEYVWDEYINNATVNNAACLQMHIIEYLIKHSESFRRKYGVQCESWIADHAKETVARGVACAACRMESFCEN